MFMGIPEWLHNSNEFVILVHFGSCSPRMKIFIIIKSQLGKLNLKKEKCACVGVGVYIYTNTHISAALIESRVEAYKPLLVAFGAIMVNYLSSLAVRTARVIQSLGFRQFLLSSMFC